MATDHSHSARKGVVSRLKSTPAVNALVSAGSIFGEKVPASPSYPLIRVGLMIAAPYSPTCISGMAASFNIDCVSKATDAGEAYAISKAVIDTLHEEFFSLGSDAHVVSLRWETTTPRQEDQKWRVMISFKLTTKQSE